MKTVHSLALASLVAALLLLLCALAGCKSHLGDSGEQTPGVIQGATVEDVARRVRELASAVARAYPENPDVGEVAGMISSVAGFVETGDYQNAGLVLVAVAQQFPRFREYAVMASIALELLSPGPEVPAPPTGKAGDGLVRSWHEAVKAAAPKGAKGGGAGVPALDVHFAAERK